MMNDYRRGWALRYLREAKAELKAARKMPSMTTELAFEAVRKAQAAIYYSLGDPSYLESIVRQKARSKGLINDPVLRCLVEIERTVRAIKRASEADREKILKQADNVIRIASDIVELLTGEPPCH